MRSGCRPTGSCRTRSATSSSVRWVDRRRSAPLLFQLPLPGRLMEQAAPMVAKVEWHPGELYPRVGFIVTNLARPAERVVAFYNHRGTCEQ